MQLVQGYSHTLPRAKLSAAPPVNAPTCGCHYNHHEGFTNFMHPNEERIKQLLLVLIAKHDKWIFEKEDKFKQPGERYRSREPGQLVWYIGYLLVLLLQARKKDLPAVGLRSLSDSQVTHEIHTDLSSFPFMFI
nr:catalase isozyme 3-like [Solanum lycopersicum]